MPTTLLYITAPSMDSAKAIARTLLDERLIACANILGPVTSLYRWEGENREDSETVLIAKTTQEQAAAAIARVKTLHPYTCPCIVSLPVTGGYAPFLEWVAGEAS